MGRVQTVSFEPLELHRQVTGLPQRTLQQVDKQEKIKNNSVYA